MCRDKQKLKHQREDQGGRTGRTAKETVPEKDMIDIKCCCWGHWAQLEDHYEIAIMKHHLTRSSWSHTSPECHYVIMSVPLLPEAVDSHKGQEQRLWVGDGYYSEIRRAAKIRSLPAGLKGPGDCADNSVFLYGSELTRRSHLLVFVFDTINIYENVLISCMCHD